MRNNTFIISNPADKDYNKVCAESKGATAPLNCTRASYLGTNHVENDKSFYLLYLEYAGSWFLMFTNLVPISLLVCLETVKFLQGFILSSDVQMYDYENDKLMRA